MPSKKRLGPDRDQLSTTYDKALLNKIREICTEDNNDLNWVLEALGRFYIAWRRAKKAGNPQVLEFDLEKFKMEGSEDIVWSQGGHSLAAEGKPKGHDKTKD
jgi:hypothetical protein